MNNSTSARFESRPSVIHGSGLFASSLIEAGTEILAFSGREVSTDDLTDEFIAAGRWQGLAPGRALVAVGQPTAFALVKHSELPNALVMLFSRTVIATLPIQTGEEITVDYRLEPMDERCRRLIGPLC